MREKGIELQLFLKDIINNDGYMLHMHISPSYRLYGFI